MFLFSRINSIWLLSCIFSVSLPAQAEEKKNELTKAEKEELAPITITATRNQKSLVEVPSQVRVLEADQLLERQNRSLPEALRELPGVNVQKTANGQGSPFIRGFTGFRNLALIDGIRFNNSIFREGPNQYWNTIDSFSIERIELVPGQGSTVYGSDSIGGTLNVLTKNSGWQQEAPGFFFHGLSAYRGSTAEESNVMRQEVQFGQGGSWGLHLGASLKYFGDVHDAEFGDQPRTGYDEWSYDGRLDVTLDPNWTLTAVHQNLRQNDIWRTHVTRDRMPFDGIRPVNNTDDLKRAYDQERSLSYIRLAGENLDGIIDSASLTLSLQSLAEVEHRIRRVTDNRQDYSQTTVRTLGIDLQLQSDSPMGLLTYGVDYYRDWVASGSQRYRLNETFVSNAIQGPVGDDASYHLLGAYLMDEVTCGERLHLFLGGRYTYASADVGRYDNRDTTRLYDSVNENWQNFSANARVLYDLDDKDQWRAFAGISQGFRAPNLSDLSRLDIARSGELELPSPGLDPEEFINFEMGVKVDTETFSSSLSYFYTKIDNMIVRRRTNEVIGTNTVVLKKNGGDGYIHGLELAADVRFNPSWSVFGHVTWTEGRVSQFVGDSGRMVDEPASRVVPLMWRAGVRWQTPDRRFWSEFVALGQSDYDRLSTSDRVDNTRIPAGGNPGFFMLAIRGGWEITPRLGINVALENLADRAYRYAGSGSNEPGFNAIFGATVRW